MAANSRSAGGQVAAVLEAALAHLQSVAADDTDTVVAATTRVVAIARELSARAAAVAAETAAAAGDSGDGSGKTCEPSAGLAASDTAQVRVGPPPSAGGRGSTANNTGSLLVVVAGGVRGKGSSSPSISAQAEWDRRGLCGRPFSHHWPPVVPPRAPHPPSASPAQPCKRRRTQALLRRARRTSSSLHTTPLSAETGVPCPSSPISPATPHLACPASRLYPPPTCLLTHLLPHLPPPQHVFPLNLLLLPGARA